MSQDIYRESDPPTSVSRNIYRQSPRRSIRGLKSPVGGERYFQKKMKIMIYTVGCVGVTVWTTSDTNFKYSRTKSGTPEHLQHQWHRRMWILFSTVNPFPDWSYYRWYPLVREGLCYRLIICTTWRRHCVYGQEWSFIQRSRLLKYHIFTTLEIPQTMLTDNMKLNKVESV